ncbi:hypothetical protein EJ08DRAFT_699381 [Tothia fuscella]|uniref:Uncharacterized protein n=1 Tax=Tothia fuscella TaxID=1048955 RepID=A0A9P4TWB3_9PEZI|nr:hypothetical protein EJ08DRAFT_699381 [Tothia fuscella]
MWPENIAALFSREAASKLSASEVHLLFEFLQTPPDVAATELNSLVDKEPEKFYIAEMQGSGQSRTRLTRPSSPVKIEVRIMLHCHSKEGDIGDFWDAKSKTVKKVIAPSLHIVLSGSFVLTTLPPEIMCDASLTDGRTLNESFIPNRRRSKFRSYSGCRPDLLPVACQQRLQPSFHFKTGSHSIFAADNCVQELWAYRELEQKVLEIDSYQPAFLNRATKYLQEKPEDVFVRGESLSNVLTAKFGEV